MDVNFVADCQNNDFQGSVAIDENETHEGQNDLLNEMAAKANLPKEFSAIGFEFSFPKLDEHYQPTCVLPISLVAIKEDEVGCDMDQMNEYSKKHGKIPYYRFQIEMNIIEILTFFKRLDVKVLVRDWQTLPFKVVN